MFEIESRQDKLRERLKNFSESELTMKLYPSELKRFKNEFPKLKFNIQGTSKSDTKKLHTVKITKRE